MPHQPVLNDEVAGLLAPASGETVVDCTFGAGGHARRLAPSLGPDGLYIAIDRDPLAHGFYEDFAQDVVCRTRFVRGSFDQALRDLFDEGVRADGILMDLGLSSMQIDRAERGFSYAAQAPLDMRMDPAAETTAESLLAEAGEDELARWFQTYGEERYARRIARAIVRQREQSPLRMTGDLVDVVRSAVPTPALFAAGHPAKRVFQALRIVVNDELAQLESALEPAFALLAPGGRFAAISFHSLEDRRVKHAMRRWSRGPELPPDLPVRDLPDGEGEVLTRRVVRPGEAESDRNPRSRSARLRAVRRRGGS
mgnify:CR=1 FL=1